MWPGVETINPDLAGWDSHASFASSSFIPPSSPSTAMDSMSPASLASLSTLLTPTESHAFHSFLSSVNGPTPIDDWIDTDKEKQALARATKDLMSLDAHSATHSDHLYTHFASSSHYSHAVLPHPPHSDSSSRTPTPTSLPPLSFQPLSGRQSSKTRTLHPHPYPTPPAVKQRRPSRCMAPASPVMKPPQVQPKPALLSASQKKANHIQSEQKRRANIRRGYEALCECVPSLREAIREEEAMAAANDNSMSKNNTSTIKRKAKSTVKGKDGEDKTDGRAGPRSENVVLSKTIDYINELLDDRSSLLARLHRARSTLPPGHPALIPPPFSSLLAGADGDRREGDGQEACPLWEREWKGGHGDLGTCGDEDDSS